jgi:hypothetical protein
VTIYEPSLANESAEYREFVDKFKPKKTTDDCYTPEGVYEAVRAWAVAEYGLEGRDIVRPFWPDENYRSFDYPDGCVVIDNPPFSIAAEIYRFYNEHAIDHFLFANHLTLFSCSHQSNHLVIGAHVTFSNGAIVNTSFNTSLGRWKIATEPSLYEAIMAAQEASKDKKTITKYAWPEELCTAGLISGFAKGGQTFRVRADECVHVTRVGKTSVFGDGYLLSELRALAQTRARARVTTQAIPIELSSAEKQIVATLSGDPSAAQELKEATK